MIRSLKTPALAALMSLAAAVPIAHAAGISVPMDEVRTFTFKKPVKTVFVGNPVIADVTVIDSKRIFVLGKNFGTTNLIALDEMGNQIASSQITVFDRPGSIVTVQRGAAKSTLACSQVRCEASPHPRRRRRALRRRHRTDRQASGDEISRPPVRMDSKISTGLNQKAPLFDGRAGLVYLSAK